MLTEQETQELIRLLTKASPRPEIAGKYVVIITPSIYSPDDFIPRKKVCIGDVSTVIGETTVQVTT